MTVIHFISNNQSDLEEQALPYAKAHSFEIQIHPTIEDFLSSYGKNHPKERRIKYEDFQEWMGQFHLVLGCWETKREWREVKQHLKTWEPRIISRFTSSSREYVEKRLKNILGVGIADSMSVEYLKKKYMVGLKRKFETIIGRKFHSYWRTHAVSAEKGKTLLVKARPGKTMRDPLQHKQLKLVKTLSAICKKRREEDERIEFRKAFPALIWGEENESDYLSGDFWFNTLKRYRFQPSDYLDFFDHCPWCMSQNIEVRFFQSPAWTWSSFLCGRAGWVVRCTGCQVVLLFDLVVMS